MPADPNPSLARASHDESARQRFAMAFRQYLFGPLRGQLREDFYDTVAPQYEAREGRPLDDRKAARNALLGQPAYQYFCDLHRISQDMIWNSVLDTLEHEEASLVAAYHELGDSRLGSLEINPDLEIPRYISAIDIHCMPGNYHRSTSDDDLLAGAMYDLGTRLYSPGGGPLSDGMGRTGLAWLKTHHPALAPRRILDLGCGVGSPTLVYVDEFPDAEVFGIDIGAAMLRYGHLRAERMGRRLSLSQRRAETTGFEDGSFDLILSHILFHETSAKAVPEILRECRRLLAPGGVMLHLDLPPPDALPDVFTKVVFDGDAYYNNEPFWMRMHELDWPAMLYDAGFDTDRTEVGTTPVLMLFPGAREWRPGPFPLSVISATVAS